MVYEMPKDDLGEAIAGILLGIIGGLALAEILNSIYISNLNPRLTFSMKVL